MFTESYFFALLKTFSETVAFFFFVYLGLPSHMFLGLMILMSIDILTYTLMLIELKGKFTELKPLSSEFIFKLLNIILIITLCVGLNIADIVQSKRIWILIVLLSGYTIFEIHNIISNIYSYRVGKYIGRKDIIPMLFEFTRELIDRYITKNYNKVLEAFKKGDK